MEKGWTLVLDKDGQLLENEGNVHSSLTNEAISEIIRKFLTFANLASKEPKTGGNHVVSVLQTDQEIYRIAVGDNTIRIQYEQLQPNDK